MRKMKLKLMNRIGFAFDEFVGFLAHKWNRKFYVHMAVLFTAFVLLDTAWLHYTSNLPMATFDPMVAHRLSPPKPDKDIVIVDIDEASLAAMSEKYGRYPWPRQVFGEFVEQVEKQHPKAIVFDILFSDPDMRDLASDASFDASIANTNNTYFPMALLDAGGNNELRKIKIADVPGVLPAPDELADPEASINVILPHFNAVIAGGRLGAQNVPVDSDGVVRHYPNYFEGSGWHIPAIPARLGRDLGWPESTSDRMLLNWRGQPGSYQHVGFAEVFMDMNRADKKRPPDEFKDIILIIGSTAPNLFAVRVTPMSETYPGVELLATAIDNYKHGDSVRFLEGRLWYLLITLLIIWLTAYAFYRKEGRGQIDQLFSLSQFILIGFSFASINFSDTYIDLAGPVMFGIAYFTLSRLYATATEKVLEHNMVREANAYTTHLHATLLLIQLDGKSNVISAGMLKKICRALKRTGMENKGVEVIAGEQKGVWSALEKTIAVSWLAEVGDDAAQQANQNDAALLMKSLRPILSKHLLNVEEAFAQVVHGGRIEGGAGAAEGWRRILGEAIAKFN